MRIAFDLDDTLICGDPSVPREATRFRIEPMRAGAPSLWRELRADGHRVGVYTSSYRSPVRIRLWLLAFGLRTNFVFTQRDNNHAGIVGKSPRRFGIDCLIDDDDTACADIHVLPENTGWVDEIRREVETFPPPRR